MGHYNFSDACVNVLAIDLILIFICHIKYGKDMELDMLIIMPLTILRYLLLGMLL